VATYVGMQPKMLRVLAIELLHKSPTCFYIPSVHTGPNLAHVAFTSKKLIHTLGLDDAFELLLSYSSIISSGVAEEALHI
jgi:hypothetical protein